MIVCGNAKINLTLDILGKREDNFHEVMMVMQSLALHDVIEVRKSAYGIKISVDHPMLPVDHTNLAWRAADLMRTTYHISDGIEMKIEKKIPIAAGLAGGSADAAAVLMGMNELFQLGATKQELAKLGAQLGSDIPFCIFGGTMLATGRGEILEALPYPGDIPVVLAKPPISVSTAWAYQSFDAVSEVEHTDHEAMRKAISEKNWCAIASLLYNVLERVTIKKHPEIALIKEKMSTAGALAQMMSGSGPTVFALAETEKQAQQIYDETKEAVEAEVILSQTTPAFDH